MEQLDEIRALREFQKHSDVHSCNSRTHWCEHASAWTGQSHRDSLEFQSWKVNFKTGVCSKTADPHLTMQWINEVEIAKAIDELMTSRSTGGENKQTFPTTTCMMRWLRVVYPCLSSSSDDHLFLHSSFGTGMRVGTQNKFCHYRASLIGSFGVLDCSLIPVGVLVRAVPRYCHFWESFFGPSQPRQLCPVCVCVLVTRYSITILVDLVKDSEKKDPHCVCNEKTSRQACALPKKSKCRRAACSWSTSMFVQPELVK